MELAAVTAAAALLFLLAFGAQRLFLPAAVKTPDVPLSVETTLKVLMEKQIRAENRVLDAPAVIAAFDGMRERLLPELGSLPYPVEILVVDSPVVNAVTLPGGLIVVYSGLAHRMESPEEMAAILAHEMGHVVHRDSLTLVARQLGMAALATLLTGGQGETLAQSALRTLVTVRYTHEAEDAADAFAGQVLPRAAIDPAAYAVALSRLKKTAAGTPSLMRYLDPHSAIDDRISRARAAAKPPGFIPRAIAVDWRAALRALPTALEPAEPQPAEPQPAPHGG
jgi:beta-barrel assembly-enhancing protease